MRECVVGARASSFTTSASSLPASPLSAASDAALFRVRRNGGDSGVGGPASESCFEEAACCWTREGLAVRREERVEIVVDGLRELLLFKLLSVTAPSPETGSDMSTSVMAWVRVLLLLAGLQ